MHLVLVWLARSEEPQFFHKVNIYQEAKCQHFNQTDERFRKKLLAEITLGGQGYGGCGGKRVVIVTELWLLWSCEAVYESTKSFQS